MSGAAPVRLVAIVGGSASGKTWLADQLGALLGRGVGRLNQDNFYRDWSHLPAEMRAQVNFDHPDALDWFALERTLRDLRAGRAATVPEYDFHTHCRRPDAGVLRASRVMIVDGLWLLHRPDVRRLFHLAVFLHCDEAERLRRRVARDVAERGRTRESVEQQFREAVAPMHRRFVDPQAQWADVVLNHPYAPAEIASLQRALADLLAEDGSSRRESLFTELQSLLQPSPSLP